MVNYNIEIDDKQVVNGFKKIIRDMPIINRNILSLISEGIIAATVRDKLSGQVLKRKTGKLAQSLTYGISGAGNNLSSTIGSNLIYSAIQEKGGTILPVNKKLLHFYVDGREVFTKKSVIPARPYLEPTINDFFATGKAKMIITRTLKNELNRRMN